MQIPRVILSLLLLLVVGSTAQLSIADLPPCGLTCLLQTVPAAGCSLTNTTCQCGNQALARASFACLLQNCTMNDTLGVSKVQASICNLPDADRSKEVTVVTFSLDGVAAILIILRLWHKAMSSKEWGWDDTIIGISLVLLAANIYFLTTMANQGFGKHIYQLREGDLLKFLRNFYIATIFYVFILGLVKISILVFYLRLFPYESFRHVVFASMIYVVFSTITVTMLAIFQCQPIRSFWDKDIEGKCLNLNAMAYVAGGFTISSDFLILVLPIPVVSKLNLGFKKKGGVILMFSVGSFGCVVSIIRFRSLIFYGNTVDPSYDLVMTVLWSSIEISVGMICACFPALRRWLVQTFPNAFHTSNSPSSNDDSSPRPLSLSWFSNSASAASEQLKSVEGQVRTVKGRLAVGRRRSMGPPLLVLPDFEMDLMPEVSGDVVGGSGREKRTLRSQTSLYDSRAS